MVTVTHPAVQGRRPSPAPARAHTPTWLRSSAELVARLRETVIWRRRRAAFARALDEAPPTMRAELMAISEQHLTTGRKWRS